MTKVIIPITVKAQKTHNDISSLVAQLWAFGMLRSIFQRFNILRFFHFARYCSNLYFFIIIHYDYHLKLMSVMISSNMDCSISLKSCQAVRPKEDSINELCSTPLAQPAYSETPKPGPQKIGPKKLSDQQTFRILRKLPKV